MFRVLFLLLFTGHALGDFYFQSADLATNKDKAFMQLLKHSVIYLIAMVLVILPIFSTMLLKWVIIISVAHLAIDLVKFFMKKSNSIDDKLEAITYLLDQAMHVVTIIVVAMAIHLLDQPIGYVGWVQNALEKLQFNVNNALSWILALLVIAKPVCITIKKVLYNYKPELNEMDSGHPNAGAMIGILERTIIMLLLAVNQFAAIGFVLTAKSIARYNKIVEDPRFSEYYLLGTLSSVLLAVLTHFIIF